jgi:hypothetical protein
MAGAEVINVAPGAAFLNKGWDTISSGMAETGGVRNSRNPAALPKEKDKGISCRYESRFGIANDSNLSYIHPLKESALKVEIKITGIGDVDERNGSDEKTGSLSANFSTVKIGYGHTVDIKNYKFGVGAEIGIAKGNVGDQEVLSALTCGFGGLFPFLDPLFKHKFELGVSLQNMGNDKYGTKLPYQGIIGLGTNLHSLKESRLMLLMDFKLNKPGCGIETGEMFGAPSIGLEYDYKKAFQFRFGYAKDQVIPNTGTLAVGFGFRIKNMEFDYAFDPKTYLDDCHELSVKYKF